MRFALILMVLLAPLAGAARAEEAKQPWTDTAELGFVMTSGNSEVTNLAFSNKYAYKWTKSEFQFNVAGIRNKTTDKIFSTTAVLVTEDTRTTAEMYNAELKYLRTISEKLYWYGNGGWQRNEFAGLENRLAAGAGVGYKFFEKEKQSLKGELGAESVTEDYVGGGSDSFLSARGFLGYEYRIRENSKFTSDLELWENLDETSDYRAKLALALVSSLTSKMALKVSYTVLYDNEPVVTFPFASDPTAPYEFEKTDTIFAATLVFNF